MKPKRPTSGGTWRRDPQTGELTRIEIEPVPAASARSKAAARPRPVIDQQPADPAPAETTQPKKGR